MKNPASRGAKRGLQRKSFPASSAEISATIAPFNQSEIDLVAILATRSRVAPATVAAQLSAWGLAVRT